MTIEADRHSARADATGDSIRTHLIAFHTGGIGVCLATAASLVDDCVDPAWVGPASITFAFGLALTCCSLFLQKHKALKRRNAARASKAEPNFTAWYWRNFTWDLVSLGVFCVGAYLAFCALRSLEPGCQ
jgi:hypothetical protein